MVDAGDAIALRHRGHHGAVGTFTAERTMLLQSHPHHRQSLIVEYEIAATLVPGTR
jgi:hypothetical protein